MLAGLGMPIPFDDALAAEAEALLPTDGKREVLLMAVALHPVDDRTPSRTGMLELLSDLELGGDLRDRVFASANGATVLSARARRSAALRRRSRFSPVAPSRAPSSPARSPPAASRAPEGGP